LDLQMNQQIGSIIIGPWHYNFTERAKRMAMADQQPFNMPESPPSRQDSTKPLVFPTPAISPSAGMCARMTSALLPVLSMMLHFIDEHNIITHSYKAIITSTVIDNRTSINTSPMHII
jgi:hypothetical protein